MGGMSSCPGCSNAHFGGLGLGTIPNVGTFCRECCIPKFGCRNCGLNWSKITDFLVGHTDEEIEIFWKEIECGGECSLPLHTFFGFPRGAFHTNPDRSEDPFPDDLLGDGEEENRVEDEKMSDVAPVRPPFADQSRIVDHSPWRLQDNVYVHGSVYTHPEDSLPDITCLRQTILPQFLSYIVQHPEFVGYDICSSREVRDLDQTFASFFTRVVCQNMATGDSIMGGNSVLSTIRPTTLQIGRPDSVLVGRDASYVAEVEMLVCKWCLQAYCDEKVASLWSMVRHHRRETEDEGEEKKSGEDMQVQVDPLIEKIGVDAFGIICSFACFPAEILQKYMLVCQNWYRFFRRSKLPWMSTIVIPVSLTQLPSIVDDPTSPEMEMEPDRIRQDKWHVESILSPCMFHSREQAAGEFALTMTDRDIWNFIRLLFRSFPEVGKDEEEDGFGSFHGLKDIVFAEGCCRSQISDVGALALWSLVGQKKRKKFRCVGFPEVTSSRFLDHVMYQGGRMHIPRFRRFHLADYWPNKERQPWIPVKNFESSSVTEVCIRGSPLLVASVATVPIDGHFEGGFFPNLKVLRLESVLLLSIRCLFTDYPSLFDRLESLSILTTHYSDPGQKCPSLPAFPSLRYLSLSDSGFQRLWDCDEFMAHLGQHSPDLVAVHVWLTRKDDPHFAIEKLLRKMPANLRAISLGCDEMEAPAAVDFARGVDLSSLLSLTLSGVQVLRHSVSRIRAATSLRYLVFNNCGEDPFTLSEDIPVFLAFPDLRVLSLRGVPIDWAVLLAHQGDDFSLPLLRSLGFQNPKGIDSHLLSVFAMKMPHLREIFCENEIPSEMLLSFLDLMPRIRRVTIAPMADQADLVVKCRERGVLLQHTKQWNPDGN